MAAVLIVDDSSAMRAFVRAALEDCLGADVTEAASGFEALRELPRRRFDLVVADINMPDINGLELIKFMRTSQPHTATPVVLISTEGSERDRARGLTMGADAFLSKPFEAEALASVVRRLLSPSDGDVQR